MKAFRYLSIRQKLISLMMFITCIALLLVSVFLVINEIVTFRSGMLKDISTLARLIGKNSVAALTFDYEKVAEETLASLSIEPSVTYAGIYTSSGVLFAEYHANNDAVNLFNDSNKNSRVKLDQVQMDALDGVLEGYPFFDDYFDVFEEIVFHDEVVGVVYVQADMKKLWERLHLYIAICGIVMILSMLLAYSLSSRLEGVISVPILELVRKMKLVSKNRDYGIRAEKKSYDELGILIDGFNEMLVQIEYRNKKLQLHREHLEEKVGLRTIELAEANKGLKKTVLELKDAKNSAEIANRAKSEFLTNVTHEIRTPMNAILGFSEILMNKIEKPEQKNFLKNIQESGKALLCLINDILDLSKIEAGRLEIKPEPLNIRSVLNDIRHFFLHAFQKKGIEFIIEIAEDVPDILILDEVRIRQILNNLVDNAIKFTFGGFVKVSVDISGKLKPGNMQDFIFKVEDTGIGVSEEQQELIFEDFRQQDGQSARKYGGTGLGLAITKRLTEIMNGTISVTKKSATEKTDSNGSIFYVVLLGVKTARGSDSVRVLNKYDDIDIDFKPATILIVDDIHYNRELVKIYLQDTFFHIIEAGNDKEVMTLLGLEKSKNKQLIIKPDLIVPDLILMDLKLPGRNGYEITRILKRNKHFKHIPMIAVTASAMNETQKRIELLFDDYLKKPFGKIELIEKLLKHLPHTVKETKPVDEEEWETATEFFPHTGHDQLLQLLTNEFMLQWEDIKESLIFFEVSDFIDRTKEKGEQYSCPVLINWSEVVKRHVLEVDIEKLSVTFGKFPEIVEKLRNKTC